MSFLKPKDEGSLLGAAQPKALSSGLMGLKFMKKQQSVPAPAAKAAASESMTEQSSSSSSSSTAEARPQLLSLSKSVMGMKFMKRSAETDQNDKEERVKRMHVIESSWQPDKGKGESLGADALYRFEEHDAVAVMPGRISFGGFNKNVERHYEQAMAAHRYKQKVARGDVITDEEFVSRYTNLIGLPGRLSTQQQAPESGKKEKREKDRSGHTNNKKKKRRQGGGSG